MPLRNALSQAMRDRQPSTKRPVVQTHARQITQTLPPYRQDQPSLAYPQPGRGQSGETSN